MESSYDKMMAEKPYLPFQMGYLTDDMVKQAKEELNETKETRVQALAELRRLIAEEKNLHVRTDDSYLLQFLRVRKFKPHKAMDVIRNIYSAKKEFPDIYLQGIGVESARNMLEAGAGGVFPYRHKDGGAIFFIRCSNWDPKLYSVQSAVSTMTALILYVAEDPATQVCGSYLIYDAGYTLQHLRVISVSIIRLLSRGLRDTLPIRFKAIHVVNESPVFRYIFNVLKMFISDKIRNRFHFHGSNMEQLHKYLPKEVLPPLYGGDNINYSPKYLKDFSLFYEKYSEMMSDSIGYINK